MFPAFRHRPPHQQRRTASWAGPSSQLTTGMYQPQESGQGQWQVATGPGRERVLPHAMGRDPFHQPRVLRAPSSLALNPAREGAATASLGSLGQGLTTLTVKNSILRSNPNPPSFSVKPFPSVLSLQALGKSPSAALSQAPSGAGRLL